MKMMGRQRMHLRRRKRFWFAMESLCLISCLVILFVVGQKVLNRNQVRMEEQEARQIAESENMSDTYSESEYIRPVYEHVEMLDYFRPLAEQNDDIAGLVEFGKDMALYVAQAEDNYYYLNHKFDRSESDAGMIYMDFECKIAPASKNIILYGHNMGDGSRFGTLKRFENADYLQRYPVIRFTSLYRPGNYAVLAIYYTSTDISDNEYVDFRSIDFETDLDFYRYVNTARNASMFEIPLDVNPEDELLTLVTCSNAVENGRLVLLCRRQREGETMEDLNRWMAGVKPKQAIYP